MRRIEAKEGKVHVLINNAGTNFSAPFPEYPADAFSKVLDVNLVAVFRAIQLFTPLLHAAATPSSPARVINISSINGIDPPPMPTYAYSTSKAAVSVLSPSCAPHLLQLYLLGEHALAPLHLHLPTLLTHYRTHLLQLTYQVNVLSRHLAVLGPTPAPTPTPTR